MTTPTFLEPQWIASTTEATIKDLNEATIKDLNEATIKGIKRSNH